jgi:hypothetical protein
VNKPTVIKKPHNKVRILTTRAITPERSENTAMPVCSIMAFRCAVSRMKLKPFQIRITPNIIRKIVSHEGRLMAGFGVTVRCAIHEELIVKKCVAYLENSTSKLN